MATYQNTVEGRRFSVDVSEYGTCEATNCRKHGFATCRAEGGNGKNWARRYCEFHARGFASKRAIFIPKDVTDND